MLGPLRVHRLHVELEKRRLAQAAADGDGRVLFERPAPVHVRVRLDVVVVVEDVALLWVAHRGELREEFVREALPAVLRLVHDERAAKGPDVAKGEDGFVLFDAEVQPGGHLVQLGFEQVHQRLDLVHQPYGRAFLKAAPRHGHRRLDVLVEQGRQRGHLAGRGRRVAVREPRVHKGPPPDVRLVDVQDARARDGGGRGVFQRVDLEDHAHRIAQRDALVGDQSEHLVVVHDRVHRLDPDRVNVAVEDDPLIDLVVVEALVLERLCHAAHDDGEHAVLPVLGQRHVAVEFVASDGLWVDRLVDARLLGLAQVVRPRQRLPDGRLAAARRAEEHDGVADVEQFLELARLQDEHVVALQALLVRHLHDAALERLVDLDGHLEAHEQVGDETEEDGRVHRGDLGRVEVAQRAHQNTVLVRVRVVAQEHACDDEDGLDGAQAPVVVVLLGEQRRQERV
mmetsp:Transcript_8669/g.29755  ORF Transcript_8669/g.29755 Transcript_8669/m.29755 type:complete len:454 (-) Transcript_8669:3386-4747(-)